jgi:HlyD family secretion protein
MVGRGSRTLTAVAALVLAAGSDGCQSALPGRAAAAPAPHVAPTPARVSALGRLEPKDGIIQVAGPSRPSVVISELLVEEGDRVEKGAPIAVLDTRAEDAAAVERARAELGYAKAELARVEPLFARHMVAPAEHDRAAMRAAVAGAELAAAEAALALDTVHAPVAGQVTKVNAREGERVGPEGIVLLAQNQQMYAVAEVYETDVGRVHPGLRAVIRSPVLARPLGGVVERVGATVGPQDVFDEDPVAQIDGRVVDVKVRLDPEDGKTVAGLSNLRVDVVIEDERS